MNNIFFTDNEIIKIYFILKEYKNKDEITNGIIKFIKSAVKGYKIIDDEYSKN